MRTLVLEHPRMSSENHFNDIANTPLWSCLMGRYAVSALLAGSHEAIWLDAAGEGLDFKQNAQEILKLAPDLLAVNTVYFWEHTGLLLDFLSGLKQSCPDLHLCLFGFFPSLAPQKLMTLCPAVDSICLGECERTLSELADALENKDDWRGIAGLAFRNHEEIVFSPARGPVKDPDQFAFPHHPETQAGKTETASVLASRGCYNHCAFCPIPDFYNHGPLWRGRSPENILREVKWLMEKGYRNFYFVDPNFIGPGRTGRQRTLELMAGLEPLGIRFGMETRPGDLDEELLAAMTAAGFESLLLGIESGSSTVLDSLSKNSSNNGSSRAIALCRQAGIEPEIGFLMHTPDATVADLSRNFDFLEENRLLDRLERTANLLCHCQIVFRGTRGFQRYREEGRIVGFDPIGFEADISWQDTKAKWVAEVAVPVCLDVLRLTGDPKSPLYWKTADRNRQTLERANHRLVAMFRQTLQVASESKSLPPALTAYSQAREMVLTGLVA